LPNFCNVIRAPFRSFPVNENGAKGRMRMAADNAKACTAVPKKSTAQRLTLAALSFNAPSAWATRIRQKRQRVNAVSKGAAVGRAFFLGEAST